MKKCPDPTAKWTTTSWTKVGCNSLQFNFQFKLVQWYGAIVFTSYRPFQHVQR